MDQVNAGNEAITQINANFQSVNPASMYGRRAKTSSGLTWGYYGGRFSDSVTVAAGTVTVGASTTTYVVAAKSNGAVSSSTNTTNWNDSANYFRIAELISGASGITTYNDARVALYKGAATGSVDSVNGQTGTVVLDVADLDDVDLTGLADGDTIVWDLATSTWVPGAGGGGTGTVESVDAGAGITVDATDPANPVVALSSGVQASLALADSAIQAGDLAAVATSGDAADVSISDAGGYFTSTDVEGALQELGAGGVGGGQAAVQFQDEGSNLGTSGTVDTLDFVGSGVVASRVGNVLTVSVSGGGGGVASGGRNRLINGGMVVNQRSETTGQTIVAGAALQYVLDQWFNWSTGANMTIARVVNAGGQYRMLTTAGGSGNAFAAQRIEADSCRDLAGGSASIQAVLSGNGSATVGWALYYANSTNNWGTIASPAKTLIDSGTWSVTTTDQVFKAENIAIPSGATTGLELVFTRNGFVSSGTLSIGDVQLESGPVCTEFERRPIGLEMDLCERYFQKSFPFGQAPAQNNAQGVTSAMYFLQAIGAGGIQGGNYVHFRTKMFSTPLVTTFNPTQANANARYNGVAVDAVLSGTPTAWSTGFVFAITSGAGTGAGSNFSIHYAARSEL